MPKLLIRRQDRTKEPETYYVANPSQDYHCKHGRITAADLAKPDGSTVTTNTGIEFVLLSATFADTWSRLRRIPQSMIAKDIGMIITTCGIGKDSIVAEAGTGNASLATQLAHVCKKVITFEMKETHSQNARKNIDALGLTNVDAHLGDIITDLAQKNFDALILDVPEPWTVLDRAHAALKTGGWLVTYSPSTTQVHKTHQSLGEQWMWIKTTEIIEIGRASCRERV